MKKLNGISVSVKLPFFIAGLGLSAVISLAMLASNELRSFEFENAERQFETTVASKIKALETRIEGFGNTLTLNATNAATESTINDIAKSWHTLSPNPQEYLQNKYVSKNPNPIGEKHLMDRAEGTSSYHRYHEKYHPFFLKLLTHYKFYDIFLFDTEGNLIYSVAKESDFATNFKTGAYAISGLGRAYQAAMSGKSGRVYFEDFDAYAPSGDIPASFLATPVIASSGPNAGSTIGVMAFQLSEKSLAAGIDSLGLGKTGKVYLVGSDLRTRADVRGSDTLDAFVSVEPSAQVKAALSGKPTFFPIAEGINGAQSIAHSNTLEVFNTRWGLVGELELSEILATSKAFNRMLLTAIAISAIFIAFLGWLLSRSVTKPINRIATAMKEVSEGNFSYEVSDANRGDEIGQIAQVLAHFQQELKLAQAGQVEEEARKEQQNHVFASLTNGLSELSRGNLTSLLADPFPPEFEGLRTNFNDTLQSLGETIREIVNTSESIYGRSTEISRSSDDLSRRTENQAATLEQTAAALDELTSSVKSGAERSKDVEKVVDEAHQRAEDSGTVVQDAISAMTEIENSSTQISQIIGVIDDIAFQTNLLALNAGVEAARAGDAGRGFAVVASEVRALAQRSSEAAKEIKTLISGSTEQVERGVNLVGKAGDALGSIVERVTHISSLVTEIASGASEQSLGLAEINIGVTQLDQVTQENAAMVEETTAAGHSLKTDASDLAQLVSQFKITSAQKHRNLSLVPSVVPVPAKMHLSPEPLKVLSGGSGMPASDLTNGAWQDF